MHIYQITFVDTSGEEHIHVVTTGLDQARESVSALEERAKDVLAEISNRPSVVSAEMTRRLLPGI
jgi:hypothetical protein